MIERDHSQHSMCACVCVRVCVCVCFRRIKRAPTVISHQSEGDLLDHVGIVHASPVVLEHPLHVQNRLLLVVGQEEVISETSRGAEVKTEGGGSCVVCGVSDWACLPPCSSAVHFCVAGPSPTIPTPTGLFLGSNT